MKNNIERELCHFFDIFLFLIHNTNMKQGIRIQSYFAVFDPAQEGGFNVSFPDFPGCVTFGKNFEQAKKMAKEVLELWIEQLNFSF